MQKHKLLIATGLLPLALGSVAAQAEEASGWSGDAEVGFVNTGGNTETQTINAKLDITRELNTLRHNANLEALNTSENETTSAERYSAGWKTAYKLDDANYLFGSAKYEDNRFSGFDYQATLAAGYGRRVLDSDKNTLDLEVGVGYLSSKLTSTSKTESDPVVQLNAKFTHDLSETAEFSQNISIDSGEDITISESVTALKAKIAGSLAMKVSFTLRNTSEVPMGSAETDRETAFTLVYSI